MFLFISCLLQVIILRKIPRRIFSIIRTVILSWKFICDFHCIAKEFISKEAHYKKLQIYTYKCEQALLFKVRLEKKNCGNWPEFRKLGKQTVDIAGLGPILIDQKKFGMCKQTADVLL